MFKHLLSCMSLGTPSVAAAATDFEPQRTYAVIAGVLEWPADKAIGGFAKENRKDRELYDTLERIGVPKEHMTLLLDEQATFEGMCKALSTVLEHTTPDSTFVFYYAGHGGRDSFLNYDYVVNEKEKCCFYHAEITEAVKKHFKGRNVLLLADCCHSGGLGVVANNLAAAGFKAASLTSADITVGSTGNWTFTQSILDALNGSVLFDSDNDGFITLGETAAEVASEMAFRESQPFGYTLAGIPDSWRLCRTSGAPLSQGPAPGSFQLKEYVKAPDEKDTRVGRIVGWETGRYLVEFYGYSEKKRVVCEPAQLGAITLKTYEPGKMVTVSWRKEPVAAKVVKQQNGFHLVSYIGWPSDKWVPATIIATDSGNKRYYIHYVGDEAVWDEWVTDNRMKRIDPAE